MRNSNLAIKANIHYAETMVPDATPSLILRYAFNEEQALLAKIRYNRLIDLFTGLICYPLQTHYRSSLPSYGQVETDELYIGINSIGKHYVIPIQATSSKGHINTVQVERDTALCSHEFPSLQSRPIAAQFMENNLIALFKFDRQEGHVVMLEEKHYRLIPLELITDNDLLSYQRRMDE